MTKTFNTNETGLKYPLIIRGLKGNNDKPTGMPNDFEHKKGQPIKVTLFKITYFIP